MTTYEIWMQKDDGTYLNLSEPVATDMSLLLKTHGFIKMATESAAPVNERGKEMAEFKYLIPDIKDVLRGDNPVHLDGVLPRESMNRIVELSKNTATHALEMLDHRPREPRDVSKKVFRVSEIGSPCGKQLWYKWHVPEVGLPPYADKDEDFLQFKFTYGDLVEELALWLCEEAGHTVTNRQMEVVSTLSNGWKIVGHQDAEIDSHIVDVKSAADLSFKRYSRDGINAKTDSFGYRYQLDAYADMQNIKRRAFLFVNKQTGEMRVFDRTGEKMMPWVKRASDLISILELPNSSHLSDDPVPTAHKWGQMLPVTCSYCKFKWACYDSKGTPLRAFWYGNRPHYFTVLNELGEKQYASTDKTITPPAAFAK